MDHLRSDPNVLLFLKVCAEYSKMKMDLFIELLNGLGWKGP